jgi:hypothetical protein
MMKTKRNFFLLAGSTLAAMALASSFALAQGHGNGHGNGNGHGKNKHGDDDDAVAYSFSNRDDDAMRDWYRDHRNSLPPGLAKKDRLPPGLEKQLVERGTLPPGLQKRIQPCPEDLERRLPPPPPDYVHVVVGGHVVLLNVQTNYVSAVFHFEID